MNTKQLIAIALFASALARADEPVSAVLAASTGVWEGELYYLDYRSGERFGIPMKIEAELTPDGATLIRRLTYTDPGVLIHAVNLATLERESGELVEAWFREGSAELLRYTIVDIEFTNESRWRVVYAQDGTDDNRPARIRHTMERDGDTISSSKEVRFLEEDGDFLLRNGSEVRKVGGG